MAIKGVNAFEMAQAQFDKVAAILDLDPATRELLRWPLRRRPFFNACAVSARGVAEADVAQRQHLEYPLLKETAPQAAVQRPFPEAVSEPADFVPEIGVKASCRPAMSPPVWKRDRATFERDGAAVQKPTDSEVKILGTPRRLVVHVSGLSPCEPDSQVEIKGPPETMAFDKDGEARQWPCWDGREEPSRAAGWELTRDRLVQEHSGGRYVTWRKGTLGSPTTSLLVTLIPEVIGRHQVRQVHALEQSRGWRSRGRSAGSWRCMAKRSFPSNTRAWRRGT